MHKVIFDNKCVDDGSIKVLCDADTMRVAGSSGSTVRERVMIVYVAEEGSK